MWGMAKIKWLHIAPCLFAIIIDALGFGLVYPVMTAIFTSPHDPVLAAGASVALRHFYLGLSYLLYPLCMFFGTSFMGDLSDSWGRRPVLLLCMLGIAISFFLMGLGTMMGSLVLLLVGRAFSGLMAGSQPIAQAAVADLSTKESKAMNMSVISMSYSIGVILGPLLGGFLSDRLFGSWFTFQTPFFIAALLALGAFFWLYRAFEETGVIRSHGVSLMRPIRLFLDAFEDRSIRRLATVFLLMQMGFSTFFQFIVVEMRVDYFYSNWQLGAINGMIGLGFALGLLLGMPICLKLLKVQRLAYGTMFLTAVGLLFSALTPFAWPQWFFALFIATVNVMAFAGMLTLFSDAVSKDKQGWAMGISGAVMAVAWMLTGFFSNLIPLFGARGIIFIGGVLLLFGSYFLYRYKPA